MLFYNPNTYCWNLTSGASVYDGNNAPASLFVCPAGMYYTGPPGPLQSNAGFVSGLLSNWAPYSNNFTGSTWTTTAGSAPTITTGYTDNVGNSASKFVWSAQGDYGDIAAGGDTDVTANTPYTILVNAKGGAGGELIEFGTGNVGVQKTLTTQWASFCIPVTTNTVNNTQLAAINNFTVGGAATIYVTSITVVQGSSCPGPLITGASQQLTPAPFTSATSLLIGGDTVPKTGTVGTDTKFMSAGTVSGTGALLCTDANAGATTSSCMATAAQLPVGSSSQPGILECGSGTTCTGGTISVAPSYNLYSTSGVAITAPHQVTYSGTMTGGALAVTLSGAAIYTSSTSYSCTAVDTTTPGTAVAAGTYTDGSHFTVTGTGTDAVRGVCTGT
jgi:hypothetical protein